MSVQKYIDRVLAIINLKRQFHSAIIVFFLTAVAKKKYTYKFGFKKHH